MASSPKDFETGNAPQGASYAAPLVGADIGARLAALPEQVFQAQQRARTTMLQQPVLDANGNVITDPQQIARELIKRGGYEAAQALYPTLWKQGIMGAPDPMNPANSNEPRPTAPPPTPTARQQIEGGYPPQQQQRPPMGAPGPTPAGQFAPPAVQPAPAAPFQPGRGDRYAQQDMPGAALTPPSWLQGHTMGGYPPTPQGYADFAMAKSRERSIIEFEGAKTLAARGQAVLDAIKQDSALTPEQKNARQSSMTPLQYKGAEAEATQRAEADTKYIQDISKQALEGVQRNVQLDAIDQLGQRVGWGPQAKAADWIGEHLGIATKGYDDIRAYKAAIDFLAPRLRPEGQGRLLEWEFHGFKGAIGGLNSTPEGRRILIQNLKLVNDYNVSLGRVANNPNLSNAQKRTMMDQIQPPKLPVMINSKEEFDRLPPGHPFMRPNDGNAVRMKPQ